VITATPLSQSPYYFACSNNFQLLALKPAPRETSSHKSLLPAPAIQIGRRILSIITTFRKITVMKRIWVVSAAIFLCTTAVYAAGPTQLVRSTPADGSIGANPGSIVLEFSEPVHFSRAFLQKDGGKAEALRDLPQKSATTQTIPTAALSPGRYVLQWEVFTGHTTLFSSHIQFTVSADPIAASPVAP
jgi:methionine-rich copper-binding protein CopC